ncbi:MAG: DUF1127 domain-containing protein [Alphaproteobacteria bacterium]
MTEVSLPHAKTEFALPSPWAKVKATLKTWRRRERDRRFLAQMSPYQRADINAPLSTIEREIAKPFWRA